MSPIQIYHLLAKCLALDFVPSHKQSVIDAFTKNKLNIEKFVRMADNHLILQALYPNLEKHQLIGFIPCELAEHLKEIYNLNSERNKKILRQIESVNSLLARENIIPLYLKGAGNILDNLYGDPGERILHDIDFLVEEDDFLPSAEILLKNGYRTDYEDPFKKLSGKHFPALFTEAFPAIVEIHKIPVRASFLKGFSVEAIMKDKKEPLSKQKCYVMSDDHKLIHCFIQAQLEQDGHYYIRTSLRYLYDSSLLAQRVDPELVYSTYGYYPKKTNVYLDIMYRSFGIKPPPAYAPKLYTRYYSFRYGLNRRCRLISRVSSLLLRMYLSYIRNPLMAVYKKDVRNSLLKKLTARDWYGKHLRGVFGGRVK